MLFPSGLQVSKGLQQYAMLLTLLMHSMLGYEQRAGHVSWELDNGW